MGGLKKIDKKVLFYRIQVFIASAAVCLVLLPVFLNNSGWPTELRDYLEAGGHEETGAVNIVSAIYLGYRAYDTLGETIVLLVAVSGTIGMICLYRKKSEVRDTCEYEARRVK